MRIKLLVFIAFLVALIVVPLAAAMRFTDQSRMPPTGYVGKAYTHKFEILAGGGCPPYHERVMSGNFPPGLELAGSDGGPGVKAGDVTGVPKSAGTYTFWIEATDTPSVCFNDNPPRTPATTQEEFTIVIQPGLNIMEQGLVPAYAIVNQPYTYQLTDDQPSTPVTWSVIEGSLPPGFSLNSTNGTVSGTGATPGDYTFKIQVSDGNRTDAETYHLSIVQPLAIGAAGAKAGEVGVPYSATLSASGGHQPYTWAATGLATGLNLDPATGAITGTAIAPAPGPVAITVTDSLGLKANANLPLKVAAKLGLIKKALTNGKVGKKYAARIVKVGGVAPVRWLKLTGKLPAGISMSARTGQLRGTPTKAGTYRFRVQVKDALGVKTSAGYILKVVA